MYHAEPLRLGGNEWAKNEGKNSSLTETRIETTNETISEGDGEVSLRSNDEAQVQKLQAWR